MFFTNPIWLWGLTGLIVPIAIHLLSRKEGKTIFIGSLRHLRDSPTAQFRHIRLNEVLLLSVRCALLTLIVMLLAGLTFSFDERSKERWVVIEKGIENSSRYKSLLDSLSRDGFELHLLNADFPLLKDSSLLQQDISYWTAVEKLAAMQLDSVVMITFGFEKNFRGERITKPNAIAWFTDEPLPKKFTAWEARKNNDSIFTRLGHTSARVTKFFNTTASKVNTTNAVQPDNIHIVIVADKEFAYDQKIITASIQALQTITPHLFLVTNQTPDRTIRSDSAWVFWLSNKPVSSMTERYFLLSECPNISTPLLIQASNDHSCSPDVEKGWIISKRLHEDLALKENLTIRLGEILIPPHAEEIKLEDRRVLAEQEMWSETNKKEAEIVKSETDNDAPFILAVLVMVTFLLERILAFQRNQ